MEMSLKKFRSSVVAWTRACNKAKEVYQTTSSFTDLTEARDKVKASYSCIVEVYDSLVALSEEDLDSSITSRLKETSIENSALLDKIGVRLSSLKWEEKSTQSKAHAHLCISVTKMASEGVSHTPSDAIL